jgi:DNA polymerase-4
LHPLAVERLWGVGPVTARKLHDHGIATVGDVAKLTEAALASMLGQAAGRHIHALAHNRDPRPVRVRRRRGSFGSQNALGRRPRSPEELDAVIVALVDRVTRRMRTAGRTGRTVMLRLRFGDFTRASRSHTLPHPTAATETVLVTVRALYAAAEPTIERRGLTLVGVAVGNLDGDGGAQLEFPFDRPRSGALDAVIDAVRDRFGPTALTRAALVGRSPRLATWLMPGDDAVPPT